MDDKLPQPPRLDVREMSDDPLTRALDTIRCYRNSFHEDVRFIGYRDVVKDHDPGLEVLGPGRVTLTLDLLTEILGSLIETVLDCERRDDHLTILDVCLIFPDTAVICIMSLLLQLRDVDVPALTIGRDPLD
jgi:hypothetical protein